ncbi:PREDICTED: 1-acyl-sn-glycerol-3-phosphate acyltransferase alpha isoform X3 [Vollenhovia emeryi]|uniref:1-acyl-sn-glycerol-3-phosphate acyltransferase alpha isoform X3 n=1 Tax=Vollenhovia emeryi TaxID=411798 RepID=UPI0005F4D6EA|nr:PREDICTED: 1-acyl-sn-glycerol-3-phosphate acyltransferase alpha isoform X3 [Vollenhovia emeryi]
MILCGIYSTSGIALLFIFVMLCALSERVRYRVKFIFFIVASALAAGLWIPFMLFRIGSWKNALMPARGVVTIAKIIGMNFRIRGKENIVKDSGCVVLINHQSSLDLCVLGELWLTMDNCTVISKKEILYLGPFGLACWLWGTVFIDRKNATESCQIINATAESIRLAKRRLLLFPEGHRHSGNSLLPFKKGAFHVAIESQMPIQPVVVSKYYFLDGKLKRFHSGSSYITILPPIPTEGMTKDDLPKLMGQAYEVMNKAFVESTSECLEEQIRSLKCE